MTAQADDTEYKIRMRVLQEGRKSSDVFDWHGSNSEARGEERMGQWGFLELE